MKKKFEIIPDESPKVISKRITGEVLDGISENIFKGIHDGFSVGNPGRLPGTISGGVRRRIFKQKCWSNS